MAVSVRVDATEVINALRQAANLRGFRRGLAVAGAHILAKLASYPPQPPNSSYRRTGRLGRSWTMSGGRGGLQVIIGNATPYAPQVQGIDEQLDLFREIGWLTPRDVVDRYSSDIVRLVEYYVRQDI